MKDEMTHMLEYIDKLEADNKRYKAALELLFTVFHEDDVVKTHEAKAIIAAKAALDGETND